MKYDPHLHHRRSIRLKGYDYSQPGAYFVTLVTWHRDCLFGEIIDGVMQLNPIGKIIQSEWQQLAFHFQNIKLDVFVVMPNHLHGTIVIDSVGATRLTPYRIPDNNHPLPDRMTDSLDGSPLQIPSPSLTGSLQQEPRRSGPIPNSLGAMIGQFKSRATKRIWSFPEMDHSPIWQRNYYEHIVRNDFEYKQIVQYIESNPLKWQDDQLHPSLMANLTNQE